VTSRARWLTFNSVGLMGAAVQLSSLALLHRLSPGRLLLDSAIATEVAILHNFLWHLHLTWRDRCTAGRAGDFFLRFQLCNGLVSLVGSMLFMQILVRGAHVPVLLANLGSILGCSLINFAVGDRWVFARQPLPEYLA